MSFPRLNQIKTQIISNLGGNPTELEIENEYYRMKMEARKVQLTYDANISYKQDVLNQMLSVFGTASIDVANANHETYKMMIDSPELFSNEGLEGGSLDTDQKVIDFATAKLASIKTYGLFRMKRFQQYKDEVATIEAQ